MAERPDQELKDALRINGSVQEIDNQTANLLKQTALLGLADQLVWGLPTSADQATIRRLRTHLVARDVVVRLHLRHPLHGKLYLCHRDAADNPRTGYVGSSNLTMAGLVRQGELNVDVLDHDATEKLHRWFEDRWTDQFSIDITDLLIEILDGSWASEEPLDPYLIYLKLAYHLSREARDGLLEFGLPESMAKDLLEYQAAAVKVASRLLLRRGGVMIGDVVGLGKTIVATAIARLLQEERGTETLVVCPKNLVSMWKGYFDNYRIHGRVLSLSMVTRELDDLRRYRIVIIDESHNLRNDDTLAHAALRDYIERNESKVVLLTATPYNKEYLDVANQLGLFLDPDVDLGLQPDRAIADVGLDEFLRKCDGRPQSLKAFGRSEFPEDWRKLMSLFLVRRTRKFIRDNYAQKDDRGREYLTFANGEKFFFPDRIARTNLVEIADDDAAAIMVSNDTFDVIDGLRLPRYRLAAYVRDDVKQTKDEKEVLSDLDRGRGNLIGITRTMLYKRLSSCPATFILSLERHLIRNRIALDATIHGRALPVGRFNESAIMDDDPELGLPDGEYPRADDLDGWEAAASMAYDALVASPPSKLRWIRSELLSEDFRNDLEADVEAIQNLLIAFGPWDQADDTKLDALVKLIEKEYPDDKVLVFTEYRDTAEYVADSLVTRGVAEVRSVSGSSDDPTVEARAFSPRSNVAIGGLPRGRSETRVLIATDVLSEGQNLQDAHVVVNFDLPWAIIRIIQRAGRVDRVGQQAEEVYVHSFVPDAGVEAVLDLRGRISRRLAANAAVFGSDEEFFGGKGEKKLIGDLFSGGSVLAEFGDDGEEVDWASTAYEIWRQATEGDAALAAQIEAMPDVVYATKASGDRDGALVYTQTALGFDALAFTDQDGESVLLSPYEALKMAECGPDEPAVDHHTDHHEMVGRAVTGPLRVPVTHLEGALSGVRKRCWDRLNSYQAEYEGSLFDNPALKRALDALYRRPLKQGSIHLLATALKERTPVDVGQLIMALHEDGRLCVDDSELKDDDLRVMCSMGLRTQR
jgi:superfamily II DNA or RNA helicase